MLHKILIGKPHVRPRSRWEDNTKTDLEEIGWGVDLIHLVQDRDRWRALVNLRVS
jgi:hypothetical protein